MPAQTSQQIIIERNLDWNKVRTRLDIYPAIARNFPLTLLESRKSSAPYFCHYMAWRLGTWAKERLIARLEELLEIAEKIPGWENEQSLIKGGDFADFWSLNWQLQVAEHFFNKSFKISWLGAGPDLKIETPHGPVFVECFVYRKSFAKMAYMEELIQKDCPGAKFSRNAYLRFSMSHGPCESDEISSLLQPLVDREAIAISRKSAQEHYPVVLSELSDNSLQLILEGLNPEAYDHSVSLQGAGDPDSHIEVVLREIAKAKHGSNSLAIHRPNIVVVNLLLSTDAQSALTRAAKLSIELPPIDLPPDIDAVAYSSIGIDKKIARNDLCPIEQTLANSALSYILSQQ
jgi:hypothetical protein